MSDGIETTGTVDADGVRVRKTVETGSDGAASVRLEITHRGDDPATVRVAEPALAAVPGEAVELDAEGWRREAATFERELDAGETAALGYRLVGVDAGRFEAVDADPAVERADPAVGDLVDRQGSDAVRELVRGERASLADATDASADRSAEDGVESTPAPNVNGASAETDDIDGQGGDRPGGGSAGPSGVAESGDTGEQASLAATPAGGVARRLLEELREGHVDDETAAALREALEPGRSHDVRIKHLQSRVADFAAYVEMLEAFVDEHGTLEAAFEGVTDEVATLDREVESLRSELEERSAAVDRDVGALEADVGDLQDGQDDLADRLDGLDRRLATVEQRLDDLEEFESRLSGVFRNAGAE
jgi:hypothetical protein